MIASYKNRPLVSVTFLLTIAALFPGLTPGEVVDNTPGGFSLRHEASIAAPKAAVYAALVNDIGQWWHPDHTFSGDAGNLAIDENGCFCETLPEGGMVRHMSVVHTNPARMLVMSGGLGPLQTLGVAGSMTWLLAETAGQTTLVLSYRVGGYATGGLERWADPVDGVLAQQLARLVEYLASADQD
jgi:uncharacterized protein YndB with AHSA1/START domain